MPDDLMEGRYGAMKRRAEDSGIWRSTPRTCQVLPDG